MKKILLILSAAIISLSGLLFYNNNVYADDNWTYITSPTEGYRGFKNVGQGVSPQFNKGSWLEAYQVPSVIIGRTPSPYWVTYLTGVTYAKSGLTLGNRNNKYNVVETIIRYEQAPNSKVNKTFTQNIPPVFNYTLNNSESHWTICQKYAEDALAIEWYCRVETSNYDQITAISIDWGRWDTDSQTPIAYICSDQNIQVTGYFWNDTNGCNDQSLVMKSWRYRVTSTQDPTVAGQQTIINQNQQIIDAQNQTNQWLQDTTPPNVDTSSLNTSVGWMPAGPVDSILTLPLQLLQGIVNVFTNTNCSPLQVPVPYINESITLPCVSTLMDDIGFTPVWNIVGGVISAVIIWDTLKWLYKFVDDTLTFRENNSGMWGGL